MMWKSIVLCASLLAGSFGYGAEQARIKAEDGGCSLEFAKDKLFITNGSNRRQLLIGKLLYTWSPQIAVPVSAEVVDGAMKVDYRIILKDDAKRTPEQTAKAAADAESVRLTALCTVGGGRVNIAYTLVSPKVKPDGMMVEIVGQDGVGKKEKYESTAWKVRPFGGGMAASKDGVFRQFKSGKFAAWLKLPGNAGWSSGWAEHAGFKRSGEGEYRTEFDFLVTPVDFTGADAAAASRREPFSLAFAGNELVVRNLGYRAVQGAELSLNGRDETVSFEPGEVKKFAFEPGDSAVVSAALKVGETVYAAQTRKK
ncbi:MAG: hypothetical protein HPZ91_20450 [Lentisphaeria bacterium]|nr:hypothetical protein [Lentisphaeria bacterium]